MCVQCLSEKKKYRQFAQKKQKGGAKGVKSLLDQKKEAMDSIQKLTKELYDLEKENIMQIMAESKNEAAARAQLNASEVRQKFTEKKVEEA